MSAPSTPLRIYRRLFRFYGPQFWWPGDSPFEILVGAILTQNTAWRNVEQALANLARAGLLDPARLHRARVSTLARLVRPAGYFRLKARKLKALVQFLYDCCEGDLARLFAGETEVVREQLLNVYGIGPETADSILLYAGGKPTFVIDAYARRIFSRLGLFAEHAPYEEMRRAFLRALPRDMKLYNEYHALIVAHGKQICVKRLPRCPICPLADVCPKIGVTSIAPP